MAFRNKKIKLDIPQQISSDLLHLPSFVQKGDPLHEYEEIKLKSEGAFGFIYRAKKRSSGALKAIKCLNASINETCKIIKVLSEAEIGLQTKHPNILTIEEVWYDGTRFFFIMDLIEPLTSSNLPESRKEKLMLFQQLVSAVAHLYSKGILHRDIKIQNTGLILGEKSRLVLFDFGEATKILEYYPKCVGTTLHIAPEVLKLSHYSDKSEVWAVISFLIEILTGKVMILHLFSGALGSVAPLHVQLKIDSLKEPPIPADFKEDDSRVGKLLLQILERGLAIDPKARVSFPELEVLLQELIDLL